LSRIFGKNVPTIDQCNRFNAPTFNGGLWEQSVCLHFLIGGHDFGNDRLRLPKPSGGKGADMNDARPDEIRRALRLIGEAKTILEMVLTQEQDDFDNMPEDLRNDETGQRAEDTIDALERAAMCCDDAISACEDALQS
jgi:hypothetical protein